MVGTDRWPSLLPRRRPSLSARSAIALPNVSFLFMRAFRDRSKRRTRRTRDAPRFSETIGKLLQLRINLLRHFQMLPHCLSGLIGEIFDVWIASVFRFLLERRQIFFMIFYHRIHVILVRLPLARFLLRRPPDIFLLGNHFQLFVRLAVVLHHPRTEVFRLAVGRVLFCHPTHRHFHHSSFGRILDESLVSRTQFGAFIGLRFWGVFSKSCHTEADAGNGNYASQEPANIYGIFMFHRDFWLIEEPD